MNIFPDLVIFIFSFFSKSSSIRLCGKQLADMLDLVCDGRGFNVMHHSSKYKAYARWLSPTHLEILPLLALKKKPIKFEERDGNVVEASRESYVRTDGNDALILIKTRHSLDT